MGINNIMNIIHGGSYFLSGMAGAICRSNPDRFRLTNFGGHGIIMCKVTHYTIHMQSKGIIRHG
jgi:hypothetical protein